MTVVMEVAIVGEGGRHLCHWAGGCQALSMAAWLGDATLGWGRTVVVVPVGIDDNSGGGSRRVVVIIDNAEAIMGVSEGGAWWHVPNSDDEVCRHRRPHRG